jgi:2-hydroxy-6-oxonona-2,4-dienedioate hydrolase
VGHEGVLRIGFGSGSLIGSRALTQVNAGGASAGTIKAMRAFLWVLAVLASIAAIVTWRSYSADLAVARVRAAAGTMAQTRCGPIEYAIGGSGKPLLLVHGAGGGFDQGLLFGKRLLESGVQIVAPSRFGYLGTPVPADASAEAQADAHACLLDALGIDRIAVLGASAGAPSAMQFCIRHPQRCQALVLLVPAAYSPAHPPNETMVVPPALEFVFNHVLTSDFWLWAATRANPGLLVRTMLGTPTALFDGASAEDRADVIAALDAVQPVSRRAAGLLIDAKVTSTLPRYELERITAPTLLVSLQDDLYGTWENARYTAGQVPGARFVWYPSGGHVWIGHGAEVMREIGDFIRGN